jgi:outer membrane protein assembly factor BamA
MLRGYDGGSYSWEECGGSPDGRCRAYEQLFGSRMALASVELRTSISGFKGLLPLPLPMEFALFADAGRAWSSSRLDSAAGLSRQWLTSFGATLRVNLFGSAIGALTYVYAPDRPNARWRWQFSMTPGF